MEVFRRFFARMQAVPTIAHEMEIDFSVTCSVMDGRLWPGVRKHWIDQVLP